MMDARTLIAKYDGYEARYGTSAPEAMLRFCRRAENSQEERCQLLDAVLCRLIVQRELAMFDIQFRGDDVITADEASTQCAREARRIIHMVGVVEDMAAGLFE